MKEVGRDQIALLLERCGVYIECERSTIGNYPRDLYGFILSLCSSFVFVLTSSCIGCV